VASIAFRNYENINRIIILPAKPFVHLFQYLGVWIVLMTRRYDFVINAAHHSSSGRLSTRLARAGHKFYGDAGERVEENRMDYKHTAQYPVYGLRHYLTRCGIQGRKVPVPSLDLRLSSSELANGKKLLAELVPMHKKTICLFTYATGDKCYSKLWWEPFYRRLRVTFPEHNFIEVLPVENISQLSFVIPTFYSKQIREIGSLIANTELFIGADSGMMHLSSAVQTTTVGLFKVTDPATFGPYANNSVAIDTNTGNMDDWINVIHDVLIDSGMGGLWSVSSSPRSVLSIGNSVCRCLPRVSQLRRR